MTPARRKEKEMQKQVRYLEKVKDWNKIYKADESSSKRSEPDNTYGHCKVEDVDDYEDDED